MKAYSLCILATFLLLASCQGKQGKNENLNSNKIGITDSVHYAQGFTIEKQTDYTLVHITNPWNRNKILQSYILVPKANKLPESLPNGTLIRTPIERTVTFSSVVCGTLAELDVLSSLVGVGEPQYIDIPYIQQSLAEGKIVDVGQAANPNMERLLLIEPEVVFASPIKDAAYGQTAKLNVPVIECVDYMEPTPLGQTEWIRFIGLLFDKGALADSLFQATADSYNHLKQLTKNVTNRPTVFTEKMYSGVWYLPGGKSYIAHLFHDAGADYLWKEDTNSGSVGFSFETVLDKAEKADFWLIKYNSAREMTYKELAEDNPNYTLFDAFKQKNIYTCNAEKAPYYKELPIHPDYVLKDLIGIFHPELIPEYKPRYYKKVEN